MKTVYFDPPTRSIIDLTPPGILYPGYTINRVSVLPPHRGQGIARRLLNEVIRDADIEGYALYLDVMPGMDGLSFEQLFEFYRRSGFEPFGEYPTMMRRPIQWPPMPSPADPASTTW